MINMTYHWGFVINSKQETRKVDRKVTTMKWQDVHGRTVIVKLAKTKDFLVFSNESDLINLEDVKNTQILKGLDMASPLLTRRNQAMGEKLH